jgi:hypothetical protein
MGDIQARTGTMDGGMVKAARPVVRRQRNIGAIFKRHHSLLPP